MISDFKLTMNTNLDKLQNNMTKIRHFYKKNSSNPILIALIALLIFSIFYFLGRFLWNKYHDLIVKQEKEPLLIKEMRDATESSKILAKAIPISNFGQGYSISVWLYINEYKLGKWKHVLHKGDDKFIKLQPGIWLHPETNKLLVRFDTVDKRFKYNNNKIFTSMKSSMYKEPQQIFVHSDYQDKYQSKINSNLSKVQISEHTVEDVKQWCKENENCVGFFGIIKANGERPENDKNSIEYAEVPDVNESNYTLITENNNSYDNHIGTFISSRNLNSLHPEVELNNDNSIEVENIPLNRWVHLVVVTNIQTAEVYIDGTLKESKVLSSSIDNNNGDLWITQEGGFNGLINQLKYFNRSLSYKEIKKLYSCGPTCWQWPNLEKKTQEMYKEIKSTVTKTKDRIKNTAELTADSIKNSTDNIIDNLY